MTLAISTMEKGMVLSPERTPPEPPSRRTSQDVSPLDTTKEAQISGNVNPSQEFEEDYQYITGIKLAIVIACITLVAFLIMLDQSIIATVSHTLQPRPALCNLR